VQDADGKPALGRTRVSARPDPPPGEKAGTNIDGAHGGRVPTGPQKGAVIQRMFGAIAPHYDLLNHLLSLNRDCYWRRKAVDRLLESDSTNHVYLDACAGTLDLSIELAMRPDFGGLVIASDFSLPMLRIGAAKKKTDNIQLVCSDALQLPVPDASFHGVLVAFGVRNLAALDAGLRELARVLRPGGRLVILEFTTPTRQPLRSLYLFYFRRLLPLIGRLVSGHDTAYSYLPHSVLEFPESRELATRMQAAGFHSVRWDPLTAGIVALHTGTRN
jgi:demethylmenaquinone methyltransferase/2-methoxy-6-polyprenyl-1,4-benzoquinol methylase